MDWFDKKILVVDDSSSIRMMMVDMLHEEGYKRVWDAPDGLAAREILSQQSFDLVLSDHDMPGMNGTELLNFIKQNYPDTMVIMLSGQSDRGTVVRLMRIADNYIVKTSVGELKEEIFYIIEGVFERQALVEENARLLKTLQERDGQMKRELETARHLLDEMIPKNISKSSTFEVKLFSRHSNTIGGDFFQMNSHDGALYVIVADIAGHGVPAALLMLTMRNAVERILNAGKSTNEILESLNAQLMKLFPESSYATISCLRLEEDSGMIQYTNEFQNPILYVRTDGSIDELDNGKIKFLGILIEGANEDGVCMNADSFQLSPGERIFILTDGILEMENPDREQYGLERVKDILRENCGLSLENNIRAVYRDAASFCGGNINDDLTMVGIGRKEANTD